MCSSVSTSARDVIFYTTHTLINVYQQQGIEHCGIVTVNRLLNSRQCRMFATSVSVRDHISSILIMGFHHRTMMERIYT